MTLLDVSTAIKMGPSPSFTELPMLLVSLALALGILYLLMLLLQRQQYHSECHEPLPDGPWGLPILGHLPFLGTMPHLKFAAWARVYGPVFRIRMGCVPTVVINSHKAIREALVGQGYKLAGRPNFFAFKALAGGNTISFSSYSPTWRTHKALGRAAFALFTKRRTADLEAQVVEEADHAMEEMVASQGPVDPWQGIHAASSAIVFSICFEEGKHIRDDPNFLESVRKLEAANVAFDTSSNFIDFLPWARPFLGYKIRQINETFSDFEKNVNDTQRRLLLTRTPGHPRNLTDAMIDAVETEQSGKDLTERHILAVAMDVMGAGQGTIVIFLTWALLYLVEYPEIQEKASEEIERVLGSERAPRNADRPRMPYCEAVCLETFRAAPSVPFLIPHKALVDCNVMGRRIPAGSLILANMVTDAQDPEVWEEPSQFRPERFIDPKSGLIDRTLSEHVGAFGMGKRRCMGEFLGRLETFIFLVRFLQRWRFRKAEGETYSLEPKISFTWEPQRYKLLVEPRHSS